MVPLSDGKHPGKKDLKGQGRKGYKKDGDKKHKLGQLSVVSILVVIFMHFTAKKFIKTDNSLR